MTTSRLVTNAAGGGATYFLLVSDDSSSPLTSLVYSVCPGGWHLAARDTVVTERGEGETAEELRSDEE